LAQYFHRSTDQLGPEDIREYIAHPCSQVVDVPVRIACWMTPYPETESTAPLRLQFPAARTRRRDGTGTAAY
jgi:hypothetical protein